ncbi:glycosyl transferase family 1, partial [Streptomyces sp. SAS_269]
RGTLSLLRGNEPYKMHWRPEPVANRRLLMARRRTAPLMSATLFTAAARQRGGRVLRRWRRQPSG